MKPLALRLADRTGELDAKVQDNPERVAQLFASEDVVKVRGAVHHYNDAFDWRVGGHVVDVNRASSVRGPKDVIKRGKTPV